MSCRSLVRCDMPRLRRGCFVYTSGIAVALAVRVLRSHSGCRTDVQFLADVMLSLEEDSQEVVKNPADVLDRCKDWHMAWNLSSYR